MGAKNLSFHPTHVTIQNRRLPQFGLYNPDRSCDVTKKSPSISNAPEWRLLTKQQLVRVCESRLPRWMCPSAAAGGGSGRSSQ